MNDLKALEMPHWLRSSAVYQVNLRTFAPEGTMEPLRRELPFLKSLGFQIIYLCPIFEEDPSEDRAFWSKRQMASKTENPKNPYRMNDYFKIDEEYGNIDDLYQLVEDAHALGMKVLLDLVYMHIGPNAPILKKHPEFASRDEHGNVRYTSFNFPFLNFASNGLREYLWSNMTYFVGELDIDGFRCDVGDGVPESFWVEGRRRIRAIKSDAVLINEGSKYERLKTAFDCCYCYQWHEDLYKIFSGEMTVKELMAHEDERERLIPEGGLLLRDFDNHDTVTDWPMRTEILAGHDGVELVTVLNYAFSGVPMVYCGNELADEATLSLFANRFHMGKFVVTDRERLKSTEAGTQRQELFKTLNRLLAENDAMQSERAERLAIENENVLAFRKYGAEEDLIFIGNFGKTDVEVLYDWSAGEILLENLAQTTNNTIQLAPHGYILAKIPKKN